MDVAKSFYFKTIKKLCRKETVSFSDKILVVGGGALDRDVFKLNGFKDVIISNIEKDRGTEDYTPYRWEYQDIENLTYEDSTFDWVFVHAGLHHCSSPHRGVCEMLRVSKRGIAVFEARDSLLNRIAISAGLVPEFELEPCVLSEGKDGGLRNSSIPNHVYRWTEREVKKTVNSFLPQFKHDFYFFYGLRIPTQRLSLSTSYLKRLIGFIAVVISPLFGSLFPKQGNCFAFIVIKSGELQPWLKMETGEIKFNLSYKYGRFSPERYKS